MPIRHRHRILLMWLLLSALLSVLLFGISQHSIEVALEERVRQHLLLTLDESLFSNTESQANDRTGLEHIGQQINDALQGFVHSRWYSAHKDCVVRFQSIDDVVIDSGTPGRRVAVSLPRNQIEREVLLGLSCSPDGWIAAGIVGLLGCLFLAINFLLPPPLSKVHRHWINNLLGQGYSGAEAFDIIRRFDTSDLTMRPAQLSCLERLHDVQQRNFAWVLEVVTDERVATIQDEEVDWFLLGLRTGSGDLSHALDLVQADDLVVIDLNETKLSIRGLDVPISSTPLFYYAWYAMSRVNGDGWLRNPASNRPDLEAGQQLAQMMSRFDGHARAINDLEQSGLKARTLDQNRSKIKEDLVAVLGETLASAYLFETSKDPGGIHMRYRLHIDARQLRIVT